MSSLLNGALSTPFNHEKLREPTSFHNASSTLIETAAVPLSPTPTEGALQGSPKPGSDDDTLEVIIKEVEGISSTPGTNNATPELIAKESSSTPPSTGNGDSTVISDFIPTTASEPLSTTSPSAIQSASPTSIAPTISSISTAILYSTSIVTPQPTSTTTISSTVVSIATLSSQRPLKFQNQNPPAPESPTSKQIPSPPSPSSLAPSQLLSSPDESIQGNQVVSAAAKDLPNEPSTASPSIEPSASESGLPENGPAPVESQSDNGVTQPTDTVDRQPAVAVTPPATPADAANTATPSIVIPDAVITATPTVSDAKESAGAITTTVTGGQGNNGQPVDSTGDSGNGDPGIGDASAAAGGSGSKPPVAAIVGGVIGGIAAVSLLALLLLWLWRKNARKNQRRSLFTPPGEKPVMEKKKDEHHPVRAFGLATMLGLIGKTLGRTSKSVPENGARGINMDRGNSQFLEAVTVEGSSIAGRPGQNRISSNRDGPEDFRVGLGLGFDNIGEFNPFPDANAVVTGNKGPDGHSKFKLSDPFTDSIILPPHTVRSAAEHRSRGRSLGGLRSFQSPEMTPRSQSEHRESLQSNGSFEERRNKFRSDQFDLELGSHDTLETPQRTDTRRTSSEYTASIRAGHVRPESYTSKYVSGVSFNEWSEPGPDIGLAMMGRQDSPTLTNDEPRQLRGSMRRQSDGPFDMVVGQAL